MVRTQNPNLALLEATVNQLGELADAMVFVGGCATGLLITDSGAPPIRATKDVDAIVQVVSYVEYNRLAIRLRDKGFKEAVDSNVICRWVSGEVILDVMPTDKSVFGFGNSWYESAANNAHPIALNNLNKTIQVITAPYFLITKLEAFAGRGNNDFLASHDMEDIIAVVDGRPELVAELEQADESLKKELANRFAALLQENRFIDAVPGHLPAESTSPARLPVLMSVIRRIANLS